MHNIKCSNKWYNETPEKVLKRNSGGFEILWDRPVETSRKVKHNRPDVVLFDKLNNSCTIIDFSVPIDQNIKKN